MKPRTFVLITAIGICAAMAMSIHLVAQDQPPQSRYSLIDLGTLGGTFSLGAGVNNRGWVSGFSMLAGDQETHATLWVQGLKTDLGTLGGPNSLAFLPTEMGQVVGLAETSIPDPYGQDTCGFGTYLICRPFVWRNGVMSALPTLGGPSGEAFGVNNRGQIVGVAQTAVPDPTCAPPHVLGFEAVLWEHGEVQQQFPTVSGDLDGFANAINDHGQAVGGTGNCEQDYSNQPQHAVLWENGAATDLGNLGGTTNNLATDINNRGQVVGTSNVSGDTTSRAFLWQDGVMLDLGTLAGDFSSKANAINSEGQLVGFSCNASGNCRAFLWQNGIMTDLNTLTPTNSPLYALEAIGINALGEITGYALRLSTGEIHAFLAVPLASNAPGAAAAPSVGDTGHRPRVAPPENVRNLLQRRPRFGGLKEGLVAPR